MFKPSDVTLCVSAHQSTSTLWSVFSHIDALRHPLVRKVLIDDGTQPAIRISDCDILRHEKNRGLAVARNTALSACETPLIAFLDSDVFPNDDWLDVLLNTMNDTSAAGVGGKLIEAFSDGLGNQWRCRHMTQHWGDSLVMNPKFLYGANCLYKTDVLRKVGGFDPRYRTHDEDRAIGQLLKNADELLVYQPEAYCYHQKTNTWQDVLHDYWSWHYSQGLLAGDYDSPEGLFRRVEIVHFGLSRYRLHIDSSNEFRHLRFIDSMIPFVFFAKDLAYLHERTKVPLLEFHHDRDWLNGLPRFTKYLFTKICPTIDSHGRQDWHVDLLNEFDRCLCQTNWLDATSLMESDHSQYGISSAY